jgi:hypothetical protein
MKQCRTWSDNEGMTILLAIALLAAAAIGVVFGAEDRPGFDERKPLS